MSGGALPVAEHVTGSAPRRIWIAVAAVLAAGLGLRLWGIGTGLPYVYNIDEADHFTTRAVAMFGHGLNPHYFGNPPAITYLLHVVFAVWFGGGHGARHALAQHPEQVYTVARVTCALLGTLAVWLLYLLGARLFSRPVGLLAASIEASAFLPVLYSHAALNDVPTLAPLTLSLLGTAGILRKDRLRDYLIAGAGLGLACATKYTAGIVALPMIAAAVAVALRRRASSSPPGTTNLVLGLAGGLAVAALMFTLANPFAILDFNAFHRELLHQSKLSGESQGKLGAPRVGGAAYYLSSLGWGLGWLPSLAALGGALRIWRREPALGWVLVSPAVVFLLFMSLQGRYFGRWLMPLLPILCSLGAFFAFALFERAARPRLRLRLALGAAIAIAMCGQGLIYAVHLDLVLSRKDTRQIAREWMVAHVAGGTRIVVEPIVPGGWLTDRGGAAPRWRKYPSLRVIVDPATGAPADRLVRVEDYERTLSPALLAAYVQRGYCWVITGSTESGRAFANPRAVPQAVAYYRALAHLATPLYSVSPYAQGAGPVPFGFDWSFDYYPLAYARPGPLTTIYHLNARSCAR